MPKQNVVVWIWNAPLVHLERTVLKISVKSAGAASQQSQQKNLNLLFPAPHISSPLPEEPWRAAAVVVWTIVLIRFLPVFGLVVLRKRCRHQIPRTTVAHLLAPALDYWPLNLDFRVHAEFPHGPLTLSLGKTVSVTGGNPNFVNPSPILPITEPSPRRTDKTEETEWWKLEKKEERKKI